MFDPRDASHEPCRRLLRDVRGRLLTTVAVLTEAFHLLGPASRGADALREFVSAGGLGVVFLDETLLARAFALMRRYADHPMDLADASLVTVAELLRTTTVFTVDRDDFLTYRARIGRSWREFEIVGEP